MLFPQQTQVLFDNILAYQKLTDKSFYLKNKIYGIEAESIWLENKEEITCLGYNIAQTGWVKTKFIKAD